MIIKILWAILGIVFFVFIRYWVYPSIKYPNSDKYKFTLIWGKPGSFKTTDICRRAIDGIKEGWKVYCNVRIQVDGVEYFDSSEFGKWTPVDDALILFDEGNLMFDNRNFKNLNQKIVQYTRLYRHNKVWIVMYSQSNDLDKKFRSIANDCYMYTKISPVLCLQRRIKKSMYLKDPNLTADSDSQVVDALEYYTFLEGGYKFVDMEPYFKYHDSFSRPTDIDYIQSETIINDNMELRHYPKSKRVELRKRSKKSKTV